MKEEALRNLAEFQIRHSRKILAAALLLTLLIVTGLPSIQLETDFQDSLPDDLEPVQAQDKVESEFKSSSSIVVLFRTDDTPLRDSSITDLRDPRMIEMKQILQDELESEPIVSQVNSPANFFDKRPETQAEVETRIANLNGEQFYNRDYTATQMFIDLEEEMTETNIREASRVINENLKQTPQQPGIDATVTGNPIIRTDIGSFMVEDSILTISAASLMILLLLSIARGKVYGPITFVPLFIGLLWTLGAMGHLGIPLTIATIALGAMILGLGVEYGSFITERIIEEIEEQGGVEEAVREAVPTTGLAILGSSTTTVVGFSALLIASISFIRNLGLTLALGIILTVMSALIITPALIIEYERWKK